MPPKTLVFGVIIIVIVLAVGAFGFSQLNNSNQPSTSSSQSSSPTVSFTPVPTLSPTPVPQTVEEIRDSAMMYLNSSHHELASLMLNMTWTGGRIETGLVGSETYDYTWGSWNATVQYPVVENPTYTVTANYTRGTMTISWEATYQSGRYNEIRYNVNYALEISSEEQVRNDVVSSIARNHNETDLYISTFSWSGGLVETGFVGSAVYEYKSSGWTVSLQYPIVENPVYTVNATYTSPTTNNVIVNWQGLWENTVVVETAYTFTP
jgi:hypothetical protein